MASTVKAAAACSGASHNSTERCDLFGCTWTIALKMFS
jgi:hypothetical protein